MLAYILRRLAYSVVVLFVATILVFLLVAESGNPLAILLANPRVSRSTIRSREVLLHLNVPLWDRYWIWFSHAIHGDFGLTIANQPVGPELWSHFAITLRMVVAATLLSIVVGISIGVFAALRKGRLGDHVSMTTNFLFLSIPTFVIGLLLKEFVAIPLNQHLNRTIFYTTGEQSPSLTGNIVQRIPNYAAHTALPVITLVLVTYTSWAIYQRSSTLDALDSDFVRLARAKGLSRRRVLLRHIVRNALIPVTTVIALDFAAVLGGAIITEQVFSWQGMGTLYLQGVNSLDINVVLAYLLVTAVFIILFNLLADVLYAVLDPRIRYD
ncbi:MAG TPA: ABC transporter permease [Acidimicrobiales bacterium]|nr:ABC transporter permease [Acidimicrobiales bacterium]